MNSWGHVITSWPQRVLDTSPKGQGCPEQHLQLLPLLFWSGKANAFRCLYHAACFLLLFSITNLEVTCEASTLLFCKFDNWRIWNFWKNVPQTFTCLSGHITLSRDLFLQLQNNTGTPQQWEPTALASPSTGTPQLSWQTQSSQKSSSTKRGREHGRHRTGEGWFVLRRCSHKGRYEWTPCSDKVSLAQEIAASLFVQRNKAPS